MSASGSGSKVNRGERHRRPTGRTPRVLLAEDDGELLGLLSWSLRTEGYCVTECGCGLELLEHLRGYLVSDEDPGFQLIVSDIRMPGATGLKVLEMASALAGFPPMILLTPFGDEELVPQARRLGLSAFWDKPFEIQKLVARVRDVAPIRVVVAEHL